MLGLRRARCHCRFVTEASTSSPFLVANFRAYWLSRLTMTLAQYAMMLIIAWQTYNIARDGGMSVGGASGQLALIGLLQLVPLFLLTPFSGLAADRFDRRNLARLTILLQLASAVALALLTWQDAMRLHWLYAIAVVLGVVRAFNGPALSALAPNLVPKVILPNAIAGRNKIVYLGPICFTEELVRGGSWQAAQAQYLSVGRRKVKRANYARSFMGLREGVREGVRDSSPLYHAQSSYL